MRDPLTHNFKIPPQQQAVRDRCFHPFGTCEKFLPEEVESSVPARFEKMAQLYPDRLAVKYGNRSLTYKELNVAANRMAHAILVRRGSRQESVALLFEDPTAMIAAILGTLKAGKCFVALDLSYPKERNDFFIRHSSARLLLTDQVQEVQLDLRGVDKLQADSDLFNVAISGANPSCQVVPDSPAFIMYTSGSTGEPKGVVETHRNVLHEAWAYSSLVHLTPEDRLTLIHSFSFRAMELHLFSSLLSGATLLPFDAKRRSGAELTRWLADEGITILHCIPTLFRIFAEAMTDLEAARTLRVVHLSGAPTTRGDWGLYKQKFSRPCFFLHRMGTTETGTVSWCLLDQSIDDLEHGVPLGWPLPERETLLLDDQGLEVAPGQIGEIAVKSRYLSPGYLDDAELTAERFLEDRDDSNKRIYRTGDLGRITPEFGLYHLGRKDFRLKIRGFRIEPGEIEAILIQHSGVKEAVISGQNDNSGNTSLIAYYVPNLFPPPHVAELRRFLESKLPDHMIPSWFIPLSAIPLNPNGKLDRSALPVPNTKRPALDTLFVAPGNAIEKTLAGIWMKVLSLERVGIHDNFFDLGGHSLLVMRILCAITDAFGIDLPMRAVLDAPTVAELAKLVERLQGAGEPKQSAVSNRFRPIITAAERTGALPLSYAEEGLWLMEQIQPGGGAWNMQSRWRLRGSLDAEALQRGLGTLIQRHELLRTAYHLSDGKPVRIVSSLKTVEVPILRLDPAIDVDTEIKRISLEQEKSPFDLAQAPLFRAILVRVHEQHHVLVVTMHHIVTDAWSGNVFSRELFSLYDAYAKGYPSILGDLPLQYSDYALWSRQTVAERLPDHLSYWQEKLKGCVVQEIPADKSRSRNRDYRGAQERITLSREQSQALAKLCKKERTTLFMLLVAAFKILLNRYTGSTDIVVGSVLAGRSRQELENLIGMFVNILPLRTDLSGQPTFCELLGRVRETCLEAFQHQEMPFEKLVEKLNPGRALSRNPFFQVLFNVVSIPPVPSVASGLTIESMVRSDDTSRFDLTLYAPQVDDRLEITAAYNRSLFVSDRIVEMLAQYRFLLEQIVENPDRKVDAYSLVTPRAKRFLPDPTARLDDAWHGSVHEIIARHAEKYPNKTAITDPLSNWSFQQLNARSNQLAHYLMRCGIERENIVVVRGQRSASLVCALLGILKAGAAFCVIDPSHPPRRVAEYLSVTEAKAVIEIGAKKHRDEMEETLHPIRRRVTLPYANAADAWGLLTGYSTDDPEVHVGPEHLAYVIFTSGSTGTPKGVMGRHGPLTHFLPWLADTFRLSERDRFSFLSTLSTNKLQREIFTALCLGGTLSIPRADDIGLFGRLDDWLRKSKITVIHLTPAMVQLLEDTATDTIPSVEWIFFGGDLLRMSDLERAKKLMPRARVINLYNASETQRGGGCFVFSDQRSADEKDIPPLGKGVKDVQLLVLNKKDELAGVGERGEICVRSPHLARGYLRDDDLTKERFITSPFSEIADDRIYRTGELGHYLPDGNVEFIARGESQASIRGFRVDLGDIESLLKMHPSVSNAAVSLHESATGFLVAHLVATRGGAISIDEIRAFLRARLPSYMIPAGFTVCESLPLTATGKLDRRALLQSDSEIIRSCGEYRAPRTDNERIIARIWSEVLKIERVGIDDDFFDLGGHSLLAVKLFARMDETFGRLLPLSVLFEAPTIRSLAERYEAPEAFEKKSVLVALRPSGTLPPIYAVPGVFGNVVGFADLSREFGSEQPFFGFNAIGLDTGEVPLESIEAIAQRNVNEIHSVCPNGPKALIGACFGAPVAYEMARQLTEAGEEVAFLGLLDPVRLKKTAGRKHYMPTPWAYKRAKAVASLVVDRLRLYGQEIRGNAGRERLNYLARKIRSFGGLTHNKRIKGFARELHQLEVYRANRRASRVYDLKPIAGRLKAFEIFQSSHPRNNAADGVKWESLWQGAVVRHKVPGKDSGDMLSGENARLLAKLLAERIKRAFETPVSQHDVAVEHHASDTSSAG